MTRIGGKLPINPSGGLHHLALDVEDIHKTLQNMEDLSIKMEDASPQPGANNSLVAFVKPEGFAGVSVEFVDVILF